MGLQRKSKQTIGVMLGLVIGYLIAGAIIAPKNTAESLRVAELEYFARKDAEQAEMDRQDMLGACTNDTIKALRSGEIVQCRYGMWSRIQSPAGNYSADVGQK